MEGKQFGPDESRTLTGAYELRVPSSEERSLTLAVEPSNPIFAQLAQAYRDGARINLTLTDGERLYAVPDRACKLNTLVHTEEEAICDLRLSIRDYKNGHFVDFSE